MKIVSRFSARKERHLNIRSKIKGNNERLRLSVFRSGKHIYAQIIDDDLGKTLFSYSSLGLKKKDASKLELAKEVGLELAKKAVEKKITKVVFDRAGYKYHGRVKSLAEGAREGGLQF